MISNRCAVVFLLYSIVSYHKSMEINVTNSLKYRLDSALFKNKLNVVVSPLAIHFSLCKLATAAAGIARDELLAALGYKTPESIQNCYETARESLSELKRVDFIMFNKVFVNYSTDIDSTFYRGEARYGAEVEPVGFQCPDVAARFINSMFDRATLKRIPNIIEAKEINNETSILLLSGVYFKVTLEQPFDITKTRKMLFRLENGTRTAVHMMTKTDSFRYLREPETNVQFVNTRLASYGVSITFGIPTRLPVLLDKLHKDPDFLLHVHMAMHVQDVKLRVPRFRIKSKLDLTNYVKKICLRRVFNTTNSGLAGVLRNSTMRPYVNRVKQNCFIDMDELGVFRAATDNVAAPRRFEEWGIEVTADRPFYFSVNLHEDPRELYNLRTIMSGVYRGPSDGWITIN